MKFQRGMSLFFISLLVILLVSCGKSSNSGKIKLSSKCVSGITTINGQRIQRYCGLAHASLVIGSKTFDFPHGDCSNTSDSFIANFGDVDLSTKPGEYDGNKFPYRNLQIAAGPSFSPAFSGYRDALSGDGNFSVDGNLIWDIPGESSHSFYSSVLDITLSNGRKYAQLTGKIEAGPSANITIECP